MKKIILTFGIFSSLILGSMLLVTSCAVTKNVADKSGAQLWGENCNRCHNAPAVGEFSNAQWDVISYHMQLRANLTTDETNKIVDYLKGVGG